MPHHQVACNLVKGCFCVPRDEPETAVFPQSTLCAILAFVCRNILVFHTGWNQLSCLSEDAVSRVNEMWKFNKRSLMKGKTWGWKRRDQKPGQEIQAQHHATVSHSEWAPWHQRWGHSQCDCLPVVAGVWVMTLSSCSLQKLNCQCFKSGKTF